MTSRSVMIPIWSVRNVPNSAMATSSEEMRALIMRASACASVNSAAAKIASFITLPTRLR